MNIFGKMNKDYWQVLIGQAEIWGKWPPENTKEICWQMLPKGGNAIYVK